MILFFCVLRDFQNTAEFLIIFAEVWHCSTYTGFMSMPPECLIHWERHEMISHLSEFQAHVPQNFFFQSFFSFICGPADHRGIGRCGSSFCELHSQVALLSHEVASLQCLQWLTLPCSPQSLLASFVIAGCCSTPTTESALLSFSNFNVC